MDGSITGKEKGTPTNFLRVAFRVLHCALLWSNIPVKLIYLVGGRALISGHSDGLLREALAGGRCS